MAGYDLTHNLLPTLPPYMVLATDQDWGYARFLVSNSQMQVQFVADIDGQVRDTLVLNVRTDIAAPRQRAPKRATV
jgi:hypothetical protein